MRNNISNSTSVKLLKNSLPQLLLLPLLLTGAGLLSACGGSETGADPGIEEFPIAYVKRSILVDDDGLIIQPDIRRPLRSTPGGDLFLKNRAAISAQAVNITVGITNGLGDVKDLDVSSDGKTLIFSLLEEDPTPNDDSDNPKWDIYTYNRETRILKRVIASDILAYEGDDIAPYFLPNNRIVFSSNRQSQSRAILLDESLSKPQFSSQDEDNREKALVLHVMDTDGSNIEQISFNQSHDLDPVVLSNGRILFSRWDNMNRNDSISLYTVLQDGSDLQSYYGTHDESHAIPNVDDNNLQFIQPRELPDGRIMLMQLPFSGSFAGGEIAIVDGENYVDLNQPTTVNKLVLSAPAVQKVTSVNLPFDGSAALEGRYSSFYPLDDGTSRVLVSKGLCQVELEALVNVSTDPNAPTLETLLCGDERAAEFLAIPDNSETYPAYGIWLYDANNETEKPVALAEVGKFLGDAVVMRPYNRATVNLGKSAAELDTDLEKENVGLLNIRSVYDFGAGDGLFNGCFLNVCTDSGVTSVLALGDPALATAAQRPARYIRLVKAVGLPNRRDPDLANPPDLSARAFGRGGRALGMKEIIGYSPIQPDGSVLVKVPANVAFYFDILDSEARRIGPRHENWLQVNAGDTLTCSGCHTHPAAPALPLPHGRVDAEEAALNDGAPGDGFNYPNTQNPETMSPYFANDKDTMAEVLNRSLTADTITPDVNVRYRDLWTDPNIRDLDDRFSSVYTGVPTAEISSLTTPSPTTAPCETEWKAFCRTVINYQEHIQPIWDAPRVDAGMNDITCVSCHTTSIAGVTRVPDAQLDLTSTDPSDEEVQHIESYRELFFNDNFQELNGNVLVDVLITQLAFDDDGNPVLAADGITQLTEQVPDPSKTLSPSMSANGARVSFFMEKMTETELNAGRTLSPATVNHANMLTSAELRLIAEYLDIGGQYFNNPFDPAAPQN